jgi:predicted ribosome quality control (RQC) complex YloA/Tae2 family protein
VNLGGQYAEEVCKRIGIDKSTPAADVPTRPCPGCTPP